MDLIQQREPLSLIAGDTVKFYAASVDKTNFPLGGGWTVNADLIGQSTVLNDVAATETDGEYLVTFTAVQTATLAAGNYTLVMSVTDGTDRYTTYSQSATIEANLAAAASATDTRSHARKVLDAIEAVLENRATKDQESYTIKDRSLTRMSVEDLMMFRDRYKAEVAREDRAERIAQGLGTSAKIKVRFP